MDVAQTKTAGVAVIGAGMVAGTHLAAIADAHQELRLTGVLARRKGSAQSLLSKLDLPQLKNAIVYQNLEDVLSDGDVSFAILLTPPNARIDIVSSLAKARIPILMEKPIARNLEEAQQIVDICETANVPLGIVFQHRFRKASIAARDLVASGKLGQLYLAEINIPWWRPQSYYDEPGRGTYDRDGGGVLINQAIHTLDLALSLTGPVTSVQALSATTKTHEMESEDFAVAGLHFENGAVGSMVASTASYPGTAETITLHYDKASIKLNSGQLRICWRDQDEEILGEAARTGGGADPMAFTHDWHRSAIDDFSKAVALGQPSAVCGRHALQVHKLIDAIERSAESGAKIDMEASL
ncbi:MAG: Gfo/Idh/MocA family oxidoreductase [Lentilitoribacter sp.]